jgi:anti-sigma-K factor RskA
MSVHTHTLTGAYATHSLPDVEEHSFHQHLVECAACAIEAEELEATAARIGSALAVTAPYAMRARVLTEISRTRQLPARERAAPARSRWKPSVLAVAASVILLVTVLVVNVSLRNQMNESTERLQAIERVLTAPDAAVASTSTAAGLSARVVVAPSQESAVVFANGLAATPAGSTYQGWLIDADSSIRSAGLFAPNRDGTAVLVLIDDLTTAQMFAVTMEPDGGSVQPTALPPLLAVPLLA